MQLDRHQIPHGHTDRQPNAQHASQEYANHATELGYQKRGAVPLTQLEMHSSMFQLLIKSTDQAEQVLLARDGLLFSILWQTCYRGFNAGDVRLENIVLPTGGSSLPNLIPKSCQRGPIPVARHH